MNQLPLSRETLLADQLIAAYQDVVAAGVPVLTPEQVLDTYTAAHSITAEMVERIRPEQLAAVGRSILEAYFVSNEQTRRLQRATARIAGLLVPASKYIVHVESLTTGELSPIHAMQPGHRGVGDYARTGNRVQTADGMIDADSSYIGARSGRLYIKADKRDHEATGYEIDMSRPPVAVALTFKTNTRP